MNNKYKRLSANPEGFITSLSKEKRADKITPDYTKELNPKQVEEAKTKGLTQLARTDDRCYGYYQLACGHNAVLHYGAIRKATTGNFKCKTCYDALLTEEAKKFNLVYHPDAEVTTERKGSDYKYYTFPCGHSRVMKAANIRHSTVACEACKDEKYKQEAEAQGLIWTGKIDDQNRRLYVLPCGHEKYIMITAVRAGAYRCRVCQEEKYTKDAEKWGIEYLKDIKSTHHDYRVYKLQCGCIKEIAISCVTQGSFECKTHPERSIDFTQPISVYLSEFKLPIGKVLKLGFAMDVEGRHKRYGLKGKSNLIYSIRFTDGEKAVLLEKKLHAAYKDKLLDKEVMRKYMENGYTECYPMELKDELLLKLAEARE